MSNPNIIKYTHHDFLTDIDTLAIKINEYSKTVKPIDTIIAISRGGLVPGVYLSHRLKLPLKVLEYSTRDGMVDMSQGSLLWLVSIKNAIVVDDIADSGRTLNFVQSMNLDLPTAVLIQKEMSDHNANLFARLDTGLDWYSFDWEQRT
jgi:hypoxanthine phosphoribosyltransferase